MKFDGIILHTCLTVVVQVVIAALTRRRVVVICAHRLIEANVDVVSAHVGRAQSRVGVDHKARRGVTNADETCHM